MGYYVNIIDGSATIPTPNLKDAWLALKIANADDTHKNGFGGRNNPRPPDSLSVGNPNRWFSWTPWNYDEIFNSVEELLNAIGFDTETNGDGSLTIFGYDSKTGNEDYLFGILAPYIEDGSRITWQGEQGEKWDWIFTGGEVETTEGLEDYM